MSCGGWLTKLASLLYPSFCVSCKKLVVRGIVLCDRCSALLPCVPDLFEKLTSTRTFTVYAVSSYQGVVAQLVQAKERRNIQSAQQLGRLMATYCLQKKMRYDFIIPVPLHWSRYMMRGYNQALIMADAIAQATGASVIQPFVRHRATKQQRLLDGVARKKNVADAFGLPWWTRKHVGKSLAGRRVLLVDDVYTTGHTLKEFARMVAIYEPAVLDALVACRVIN